VYDDTTFDSVTLVGFNLLILFIINVCLNKIYMITILQSVHSFTMSDNTVL